MSTLVRKVLRDFWNERARAILVVLAIAAGVAAFSALMSSYAILVRELDRGYLETNPASATFWIDGTADEPLLDAIRTSTPVSEAEARSTVRGRIRVGPMEWKTLFLFVVEDYGDIRVSVLEPQAGAWPPKRGEILIERDAFQVAKTRIGANVMVRVADGTPRALRVTGSVHDVGQAQARMEQLVYGYVTLETLALLGGEPKLDEIKILVRDDRYDEPHVKRVAEQVRAFLESRGRTVRRMEVPAPGKHPHADLTGMLMLTMSGFGVFVLLLSGILVVNLLTASMAAQVRQIGVMKAIGGTRAQIARGYFAQALLLGAAAVAIAIPAGMWGARLLCRQQATFLNFDIHSFSVPLWVYALDVAAGIGVPLLAAAYPVWKGTAVSVREALSDYGLGARWQRRRFVIRGGSSRTFTFAIRNAFRKRARLVLTVVTLAAGGLFFMSALNIRASLIRTFDTLFEQRKYELSIGFSEMVPLDAVERAVRNTPGIAHAEGWIAGEGSIGKHEFTVLAVPAQTKLIAPRITEGRWFERNDRDALVVNTALAARHPQMRPGNTVTFHMDGQARTWSVIGIIREPFARPLAYAPQPVRPGRVNGLRLALGDENVPRVEAALERGLEREGLRATGSHTTADSRAGFDQHMLMIYVFLIVVSAIILGVGALGLTTTMSLNVLERRREMGVLRAIGASRAAVWMIVAAEGAVIGFISWIAAALIAWPVSKFAGDALVYAMLKDGLDFVFEIPGLLIWLAIAMGASVLAGVIPAWHASRGEVREALAYE
jgi:putative ABC transport system permease protein